MLQNGTGPYGLWSVMNGDVYWDRTSGILIEMIEEMTLTRQPEGYVTYLYVHVSMTETNVWSPAPSVSVEVCFESRALNLKSRGKWVMVHVRLPEGYDISMIDISSVRLNGTIPATHFKHKVL